MQFLQGQHQVDLTGNRLNGSFTHSLALVAGLGGQLPCSGHLRGDPQGRILNIGIQLERINMYGRDLLQPHGLPDAGGAGIVAAVGNELIALLAGRLTAAAQIILRTDGNDRFAILYINIMCNVEAEGGIAALVGTDFLAVDVDGGQIIHRTEVQNDPLPCFCQSLDPAFRQGQLPAVPHT